MEDIQLNNFIVKSNIHDYEVCFISNVEECFIQELISGDFIIIDNKLISLFPKLFKKLLSDYDYIAINATESQKSYQNVEPIINQLIKKGFKKK